ncbi:MULTISPECIES: hypothetical protein [Priestia]|uniref:hypothetical protein n=1 Tax=Priestia TaxID=2800373 RepID=UPI001ADA2F66|nr:MULTISPECIES: hypothetical protein [Priestia]QTL51195.1 hypothetical protein J5Z55_08980 [Priestia aryabhattai]USL44168.1 hypothetical protein LIS78_08970 [Priestia megaterium]
MRKYIILDMPINDIKKVMIVKIKDEVNMFLYDTLDDVPSIGDYSFETLQEAEDFFNKEFSKEKDSKASWIYVPNPIEECQEDIIKPVRIKAINTCTPQWGTYEEFVNGKWIDIKF